MDGREALSGVDCIVRGAAVEAAVAARIEVLQRRVADREPERRSIFDAGERFSFGLGAYFATAGGDDE